jgi:hypothetical protein
MVAKYLRLSLLLGALCSSPAQAVWQNELFGDPAPEYFHLVYPKLLAYARNNFEGKDSLSKDASAYLERCAATAGGWYLTENRQPAFALRLSVEPSSLIRQVSVRCLTEEKNKNGEIWALRKKILASLKGKSPSGLFQPDSVIGFEFTFGRPETMRVILKDRELELSRGKLVRELGLSPFEEEGSPKELASLKFPYPSLVQGFSRLKTTDEKAYFRLELRAYIDGVAPAALRTDIEALHREFGLLADSLRFSHGQPVEVFFP